MTRQCVKVIIIFFRTTFISVIPHAPNIVAVCFVLLKGIWQHLAPLFLSSYECTEIVAHDIMLNVIMNAVNEERTMNHAVLPRETYIMLMTEGEIVTMLRWKVWILMILLALSGRNNFYFFDELRRAKVVTNWQIELMLRGILMGWMAKSSVVEQFLVVWSSGIIDILF